MPSRFSEDPLRHEGIKQALAWGKKSGSFSLRTSRGSTSRGAGASPSREEVQAHADADADADPSRSSLAYVLDMVVKSERVQPQTK